MPISVVIASAMACSSAGQFLADRVQQPRAFERVAAAPAAQGARGRLHRRVDQLLAGVERLRHHLAIGGIAHLDPVRDARLREAAVDI
ncbi:MAG: hypothetical protein VB141_02045 [Burkholderia gladioli]